MGVQWKSTRWVAVAALAVVIAACGSGDGDVSDLGDDVFGGVGEVSGDVDTEDEGAAEVGPVTQTADPASGWVEVEGERHEFSAFGAINFVCDLTEDRISINFQQTTSGSNFTLQGGIVNGQWNANLTFVPGEDEQIQYGASVGFDPGTLGLGDGELSYEGTLSRVEDFDVQNAQDVEGALAVNCASPGGEPKAEVDGTVLEFPLSGSQNTDCVIDEDLVEVLISRSQPERTQLQIDVEDNGGELFGAVHVTAGDVTYTSFVPPDGTGLSVEGSRLSYEGVFSTPEGDEVDGNVTLACG